MLKNSLNIALFLIVNYLLFMGFAKWHKSILLDELWELYTSK